MGSIEEIRKELEEGNRKLREAIKILKEQKIYCKNRERILAILEGDNRPKRKPKKEEKEEAQ